MGRLKRRGNVEMMWRRSVRLVLLVLLALPAATARAQEAEGAWQGLVRSGRLRWGDRITVNGVSTGVVRKLTLDSLVVASGDTTRSWAAADVRAIQRRDPIAASFCLGFVAGLGGMSALAYALHGNDEQAGYFRLLVGYPVAGATAVVAALVDARHWETVYGPGDTARVSLSPVLTKGGAGARMSVGW